MRNRTLCTGALFLIASWAPAALAEEGRELGDNTGFHHVLLISIDGFHAVDFLNLRVPVLGGILSCRQTGSFRSGEVEAVAEEFHKDDGFGGSCEKFRKGIAEGNTYDLFGGGESWPNGTYPGAKGLPY